MRDDAANRARCRPRKAATLQLQPNAEEIEHELSTQHTTVVQYKSHSRGSAHNMLRTNRSRHEAILLLLAASPLAKETRQTHETTASATCSALCQPCTEHHACLALT
jgi:hypothetical protein